MTERSVGSSKPANMKNLDWLKFKSIFLPQFTDLLDIWFIYKEVKMKLIIHWTLLGFHKEVDKSVILATSILIRNVLLDNTPAHLTVT